MLYRLQYYRLHTCTMIELISYTPRYHKMYRYTHIYIYLSIDRLYKIDSTDDDDDVPRGMQ